jgi:archaellum biogenesis ATPase FlaH
MLVVREHPNRLKQMHEFEATKILWLTRRVGVDHIDPTELSLLSLEITKFVQSMPRSVVLLEGLEYIITQNDFETVLRFVNHLHDFVLAHDCAVIIVVDPRVLSTRELALLERSARIVEPIGSVLVRAESATEEQEA